MTATRRITRDDLESKFRELQGDVETTVESAKSYVLAAGAVAVLLMILMAFLFGKRSGKKKRTVVEVVRL